MREVDQLAIKKLVRRMHADAMKEMSNDYFLTLKYRANKFAELIDEKSFKSVLGFLPNIKHNHQPFIMSVSHNITTGEYEVTVINPRVKA